MEKVGLEAVSHKYQNSSGQFKQQRNGAAYRAAVGEPGLQAWRPAARNTSKQHRRLPQRGLHGRGHWADTAQAQADIRHLKLHLHCLER